MGPIWIGDVEIGRSFVPSGVSRPQRPDDESARILVRLHHEVLGVVDIPLRGEPIDGGDFAAAVLVQLAGPLLRHLESDGLPVPEAASPSGFGDGDRCTRSAPGRSGVAISVVVCTRDRPEALVTCLKLLQQLVYEPFEVIVVDNAPSTEAARECFSSVVGDDARFRYVREAVPGLSRARNRGVSEASGPLVAFTDDDVQVDPWWLDGIAGGFGADSRVGCVTGLVFPIALDNPSQQYFERRFRWGSRVEHRAYSLLDGGHRSTPQPYSAGVYGTGANFAVDRTLLEELGGFDEALGAGSPAGGGEELDVFVRVLRAGRTLVYAPSAVVWHSHRADRAALRRQLFSYGAGLTAFLSKYVAGRSTTADILARVPQGTRQILRAWRPLLSGGRKPVELVFTEVLGMAVGPVAYVRGRRRVRGRPQAWPPRDRRR